MTRMPVLAIALTGLAAWPAAAQTAPHHAPRHHGAPHHARPGHAHGTASPHVTPKRQQLMEQQMRARGRPDPQSADTDRLNEQSLQRAQGTPPGTPVPRPGP